MLTARAIFVTRSEPRAFSLIASSISRAVSRAYSVAKSLAWLTVGSAGAAGVAGWVVVNRPALLARAIWAAKRMRLNMVPSKGVVRGAAVWRCSRGWCYVQLVIGPARGPNMQVSSFSGSMWPRVIGPLRVDWPRPTSVRAGPIALLLAEPVEQGLRHVVARCDLRVE